MVVLRRRIAGVEINLRCLHGFVAKPQGNAGVSEREFGGSGCERLALRDDALCQRVPDTAEVRAFDVSAGALGAGVDVFFRECQHPAFIWCWSKFAVLSRCHLPVSNCQ